MNRFHVLFLTIATILPAPATADTWPQWRGPNRDGKIAAKRTWPKNLQNLKQTWRVELGPSYSGPIVAEDRVFITETVDEKIERVRALDRKTGKEIWQAEWPGAMSVPFFAKSNGDWIRSTPAYDGKSLYVAGMQDVLVCLDAKTGTERWRINFPSKFETAEPTFGFVPSPLVDETAVYAFAGQSFFKLNKKTGDVIWRTLEQKPGSMVESGAFSSPIFATLNGKQQILVQTRTKLCGVDATDGTVLWEQDVPNFRGCNILTPTVYGNNVLTSSYQNATYLYNIAPAGDALASTEGWTNTKMRAYMSSPVIIGDYAYFQHGGGRFGCIDLRDGSEKWRTKKYGDYWSLVANGDLILALDERGELLLVRANPNEFTLLDEKKVSDDDAWAHLAVADDELFVRERRAIAAYEWK